MSDVSADASKAAWVAKVLGLTVPDAASLVGPGKGQAVWARSRAAVIATLRDLEKAIRGVEDPLRDKAIILVRSIAANLTEAPSSRQSIAELRRYLETDNVIDDAETPNGFGIDVRIRAPLSSALDVLERDVTA